ncbi:hypothetical protein [Salipiger marinus]|jgi:hypothetical protein|uniref:Uncharacterized protein n=1 Tax=Salipiger marinus TaxID=555512 RepID=A0A1G8UEP5_9RHOB|nr:hypothetical protein [Salipiger marinus]SDJ52326.1 hypothetical protein SAMN04487993_104024 [Salipiger marinus]|tara:strand:- start:12 stop:197 length:186 start_codon:yes stop_codon:yes gene_type:complete
MNRTIMEKIDSFSDLRDGARHKARTSRVPRLQLVYVAIAAEADRQVRNLRRATRELEKEAL